MVHPYGTVGLQAFYQTVDSFQVPVFYFPVPAAVEPDLTDFAVIGEQFRQLVTHIIYVFLFIFIFIRWLFSVPQRIIDGKFQPVFFTGFRHFCYDIGLDRR